MKPLTVSAVLLVQFSIVAACGLPATPDEARPMLFRLRAAFDGAPHPGNWT
jgi:hypothetical protein